MSSPTVDQTLHYTRKNWPLISGIVAVAVLWGMTAARVEALEKQADKAEDDRLKVVRIAAEVANIRESLHNIRDEQRQLSDELREVEDSIGRSFDQLLDELRRGQPITPR